MLRLAGEASAAWAAFDAGWYLRRHPEVRLQLPEQPAAAEVMDYYLDRGQRLGHSPNLFFDEPLFLQTYAGAAQAVRSGAAESGFDAYCRSDGRHRMPHWLFDQGLYHRNHPDLDEQALAAGGMTNAYDHFLRHGCREGRIGSLFFDAALYRSALPPEDAEAAEADGAFIHYLKRLHEGRGADAITSRYFTPAWYRSRYRDVLDARFLAPLHHYLANATPTRFDPLPEFSEQFYMKRHPDIAMAIEAGGYRNAYQHFLNNGVFELRAPSEALDLRYYAGRYPSVRADIERRVARDAFEHYLAIGRPSGLHGASPPEEIVSDAQARALLQRRAQTLVRAATRRKLDFSFEGKPAVSVVMAVRDGSAPTLRTLAALRGGFAGAIDLIVVDLGSTNETLQIERCVLSATVLRLGADIGPSRGRNAGLQGAGADAVLFLDPAAEPEWGAVAAAVERLSADPGVGAVGGMVLRPDGMLDAAGCIVWRDGTMFPYLHGAAATVPEANFVRETDFVPPAFLMARTELLLELEGFADDISVHSLAVADLCLRVRQAGYRVIYDPAVVVHRSAATAETAVTETDARAAQDALLRRNAEALRERPASNAPARVFARSPATEARRILFIEDTLPLRGIGSGFVRSNDVIAAMASMGFHVTILPMNSHAFDAVWIAADIPETAEVMHDSTAVDLPALLQSREGYYDTIWVARTHNLNRIRPVLERAFPDRAARPRLILDTEAIASRRTEAEALLAGRRDEFDLQSVVAAEFADAQICDAVVAVTEAEARTLRGIGLPNVSVLGHVRRLQPTGRSFQDRLGMLFVGAIHRMDSPNYDSLCWFADAVLPLVERALGWETRLTVAGYAAEGVGFDRFRAHPRITLRGAVADLTPLYDAHRIFVAPTRFAAGAPYKVHEAASFGIPVIATELLRAQTGWSDGVELLSVAVDDAAAFAQRIISLHRDPALWQRLRDAAFARLQAENGEAAYLDLLRAILG
jgi:GT2 family glycosyltransferase/glycosyltransferase involved in cell wall biosynthesis